MTRLIVSALLTTVVGLAGLAVSPSPVRADCSCEVENDMSSIDAAPAALAGSVVGRDGNLWVVEVIEDVKGNLPDQVAIEAYENSGDNCGVIWLSGRRVWTLARLDDGHLEANGCDEIDDDLLRDWEPPTDRPGRTPDLLVGGGWGPYRLVAFDGDERIAFGREPGTVMALGVCPAEAFVTELVLLEDDTVEVAVRNLSSFDVTAATNDLPGLRSSTIDDETAGEGPGEWWVECTGSEAQLLRVGIGNQAWVAEVQDGTLQLEATDDIGAGQSSPEHEVPVDWPAFDAGTTATVALTSAAPVNTGAPAPTAAPLALDDPPDVGRLSPWLLVFAAAVGALYVAKNVGNPDWRARWSRPQGEYDEDGRLDGHNRTNWFDRFRP